MAEERSLYRLNDIAHVAGSINEEITLNYCWIFYLFGFFCHMLQPTRCIYSVWRQQNMLLHDRIVLYLERAGLYHLTRLNASAFIKRWRLETHTFNMPFGKCTIILQDVAYQLGLPVDGLHIFGCLTDFEKLMEEGKPAWEWFQELFGELPPQNKVKQYTVHFTWFHERFRVLPNNATEDFLAATVVMNFLAVAGIRHLFLPIGFQVYISAQLDFNCNYFFFIMVLPVN
ncbi:hypothetical protein Ahy_A09g043558 [Arachis hypogaea]|uniref:Aminotransferase-like plant mobile domain-containing protein n=1 Tax=Arachis hypogaea TaxID=3818 RepID=A0A445BIM2_ARAHY|nr:hypothetical protein Ahy_A09g043558 [Arachis hypogaea]